MSKLKLLVAGAFVALAVAMAGCDYNNNDVPLPTTPTAGMAGATVTVTAGGVEPMNVTISRGQSVTFVNSDSVAHQMTSGPVPSYDECPEINRAGRLEPGQQVATDALPVARSCQFLDLLRTGDARWQGTIVVQ
jgi:plastocyanin